MGSFGTVYKGKMGNENGRDIAIKIIPFFSSNEEGKKKERETIKSREIQVL
jgi:calcium-dependent protein kinase